jgi:hypothetical protein
VLSARSRAARSSTVGVVGAQPSGAQQHGGVVGGVHVVGAQPSGAQQHGGVVGAQPSGAQQHGGVVGGVQSGAQQHGGVVGAQPSGAQQHGGVVGAQPSGAQQHGGVVGAQPARSSTVVLSAQPSGAQQHGGVVGAQPSGAQQHGGVVGGVHVVGAQPSGAQQHGGVVGAQQHGVRGDGVGGRRDVAPGRRGRRRRDTACASTARAATQRRARAACAATAWAATARRCARTARTATARRCARTACASTAWAATRRRARTARAATAWAATAWAAAWAATAWAATAWAATAWAATAWATAWAATAWAATAWAATAWAATAWAATASGQGGVRGDGVGGDGVGGDGDGSASSQHGGSDGIAAQEGVVAITVVTWKVGTAGDVKAPTILLASGEGLDLVRVRCVVSSTTLVYSVAWQVIMSKPGELYFAGVLPRGEFTATVEQVNGFHRSAFAPGAERREPERYSSGSLTFTVKERMYNSGSRFTTSVSGFGSLMFDRAELEKEKAAKARKQKEKKQMDDDEGGGDGGVVNVGHIVIQKKKSEQKRFLVTHVRVFDDTGANCTDMFEIEISLEATDADGSISCLGFKKFPDGIAVDQRTSIELMRESTVVLQILGKLKDQKEKIVLRSATFKAASLTIKMGGDKIDVGTASLTDKKEKEKFSSLPKTRNRDQTGAGSTKGAVASGTRVLFPPRAVTEIRPDVRARLMAAQAQLDGKINGERVQQQVAMIRKKSEAKKSVEKKRKDDAEHEQRRKKARLVKTNKRKTASTSKRMKKVEGNPAARTSEEKVEGGAASTSKLAEEREKAMATLRRSTRARVHKKAKIYDYDFGDDDDDNDDNDDDELSDEHEHDEYEIDEDELDDDDDDDDDDNDDNDDNDQLLRKARDNAPPPPPHNTIQFAKTRVDTNNDVVSRNVMPAVTRYIQRELQLLLLSVAGLKAIGKEAYKVDARALAAELFNITGVGDDADNGDAAADDSDDGDGDGEQFYDDASDSDDDNVDKKTKEKREKDRERIAQRAAAYAKVRDKLSEMLRTEIGAAPLPVVWKDVPLERRRAVIHCLNEMLAKQRRDDDNNARAGRVATAALLAMPAPNARSTTHRYDISSDPSAAARHGRW